MIKRPEYLEVWEMTREVFEKQKKLRRDCRRQAAMERQERKRQVGKTGFPAGAVYGMVEMLADLPSLDGVDHRAVAQDALARGEPVPREVVAEYPDLVSSLGI